MNYTTNYQLPQWVKEDRIMMEDFNDMTAKVDEALGEVSGDVAAQTVAIAAKGNCQIYTTSYVGTGTCGQNNPTTLTFPAKPVLVHIVSSDSRHYAEELYGSEHVMLWDSGNTVDCDAIWGETTLSWFHPTSSSGQLNEEDVTYHVMALIQMGA